MAAGGKTEVHHRISRSLLAAHDRMTACGELDGAALQAWFDFEEECHRRGVSPDLSREEIEDAIEGSTVEVSWEEHRIEIRDADWPRWGRMGGLRVLKLYGPTYFIALARRRWSRITADELESVRERLRQAREAAA
jgi:hypothetical protein